MFYRILSDSETSGKIYIPKGLLKSSSQSSIKSVVLCAGHKRQNGEVDVKSELKENELLISKNLLDGLSIPDNLEYQVKFEKDLVRIGPIIGLLMFTNKNTLTRGRLRKILSYTMIYPEIRGLLVVFSSDTIDFKNRTVEGYFYNGEAGRTNAAWEKGIFPLPDAIFQRTILGEDIRAKLIAATDNCLFNSNYFNKWDFWRIVSKAQPLDNHLPSTRLYKSIEDIDYIVSNYGAGYLKPLYGTLSRGIYKVTGTRKSYSFQGKKGAEANTIYTKEEAEKYVDDIMKNHRYLVQQSISPIKVKGRHLDFRVIMQKDHTLNWKCTGIVALIGARGDICTNWGTTSSFDDVLYKAFNFSQKEIFKKKGEVIAACKNICEILDSTGDNYADLGFDVIIDDSLKVWVLEANKRHYHSVPLWINDYQTFYNTKANPMKYAAAIAGFNVY